MKDLSAFIIPRHLDAPEKILFFTYPELAIIMGPTVLGISGGFVVKGVLAGIACLVITKKLNPANKSFNLPHIFYWYCPDWLFKTSVLPPSHIKVFLG